MGMQPKMHDTMSQSDDKHTGITLWCKFACIADIKIWPIEPTYDQFCKKSVTAEVLLCNIIKTGKKICFPISIYHNDGTEMSQIHSFIHSFHWHAQNSMIPCHSQELLPFLSVMYFFLPPFSTNYSSILSPLILPSIFWSTSQSCCSQIHIQYSFGNSIFSHSLYMSKPT